MVPKLLLIHSVGSLYVVLQRRLDPHVMSAQVSSLVHSPNHCNHQGTNFIFARGSLRMVVELYGLIKEYNVSESAGGLR
jgi:hypothetical protein